MKPKLLIIGDVAFETTIVNDKTNESLGGSALYATLGALATKQKNYLLIASVGYDFDFDVLNRLGIDSNGLTIIESQKTARFITEFLNESERHYISERGALNFLNYKKLEPYLDSSIAFLSGSNPRIQIKWIEYLKRNHYEGQIAVDLFEKYCDEDICTTKKVIELSDIVFMNEKEKSLINDFSIFTNKKCIIKKGALGASYTDQYHTIDIHPSILCNAIDTNGAGDILAGSFLAHVVEGLDIHSALKVAVNIATFSVGQTGVYHIFSEDK